MRTSKRVQFILYTKEYPYCLIQVGPYLRYTKYTLHFLSFLQFSSEIILKILYIHHLRYTAVFSASVSSVSCCNIVIFCWEILFGASVQNVLLLVSKEFLLLVTIAFFISIPVTWWAMHAWLQDFAYRINISAWVFAIAGVVVILIAFLTISFQAIKAAIANPVKSLRTEQSSRMVSSKQ